MESTSESESSRGLNSSIIHRNPRILRANNTVKFSAGDSASHDSGHLSTVRKGRPTPREIWPHVKRYKAQAAGTGLLEYLSLRQWLDNPEREMDSLVCIHIFSQIVDIVNIAHSQGVVVHNVKPSCFVISSVNNKISFMDSASCFVISSVNNKVSFMDSASSPHMPQDSGSQLISSVFEDSRHTGAFLGSSELQSCWGGPVEDGRMEDNKQILVMESYWYTPPAQEEVSSAASDVYQLGVLLFELFCSFSSPEDKRSTMASLRHRVFPPHLLLKWPKEASFCLWLLHPDPSSRPKMGELLGSEFLNVPKKYLAGREAAMELGEKIEEQNLLLEFLLMLQQKKQDAANSLYETVSCISSDIEEATRLQGSLKAKGASGRSLYPHSTGIMDYDDSSLAGCRNETRLMMNLRKLESTYLLMRQRAVKPRVSNLPLGDEERAGGWIHTFLEGLCKYLGFSKLKVKADFKQGGDVLNSSNQLVCSLSFDRDGEFFATAGVNKKIKVFEYSSIVSDDEHGDIHYPVVEMACKSKLSSICWNGCIKSQIASSNFDGMVQVWDVRRSEALMEMREHERRVWSVDFSVADPTLLASGSDDGSIKLWSINQGVSVGTIRTKANICCVQFPKGSGRTLTFGSADHRIYYYDLRNSKVPLCTFVGHNKTVSYVKFIDSTTLVSASTDNTIKLWDLSSVCTSTLLHSSLQSYTGHLNLKNFVGLSVSDGGHIATGSETNEIFIYHKAFPMPTMSFKFNTTDPFSSDEVDDNSHFISSVCWRGQSTTLVAANSMGNIKLLEMA